MTARTSRAFACALVAANARDLHPSPTAEYLLGGERPMRCIYCLNELSQECFQSVEHVVPQSMGKFEHNLTLKALVCDRCNQLFGNTIDLMLARGSVEALHRLEYGVKGVEGAARLKRDRIRFSLPFDGDWNGLIVEAIAECGHLAIKPVPQVGFRKTKRDRFTFVSEYVLQLESTPLPEGPYCKEGILVVADTSLVEERLITLLRKRKLNFEKEWEQNAPMTPGEEVRVEVVARCDRLILRCIAKIAFNYLAYHLGREFALNESFDEIRRFIRWDGMPPYPPVLVDDVPILADDSRRLRQTNGHLVTLEWGRMTGTLLAQVSLFNQARYRVCVTRSFRGIWRPVRYGHHFNLEARTIQPLLATSLVR